MTIKALIVDDEELGRINLEACLATVPQWQVAASCDSVDSALQVLNREPIDVVFLDIQMPEVSGLELARRLSLQASPPVIIFVTAYDAYALHAFDYFALDYLLKPFSTQRLHQTLVRAQEMISLRQKSAYSESLRAYLDTNTVAKNHFLQKVTIRSLGEIEVVSLDAVNYMSSAGNYVELHVGEMTKLLRLTMNHLEEKLDPKTFIRIHRSHIVRIANIEKLTDFVGGAARLTLNGGVSLPVSQAYLNKLKEIVFSRESG